MSFTSKAFGIGGNLLPKHMDARPKNLGHDGKNHFHQVIPEAVVGNLFLLKEDSWISSANACGGFMEMTNKKRLKKGGRLTLSHHRNEGERFLMILVLTSAPAGYLR